MQPFAYHKVRDAETAIAHGARDPQTIFLAGGTDLVQLLEDGISRPQGVVDISALPFDAIATTIDGLRIGALAKLADVADHAEIRARYPAIAAALGETASPMVRNMATMGGNLLQRTRCLYFRDGVSPCNKRAPGSGCSARLGHDAQAALFGASEACVATHPSDLAVALLALDAEVLVVGPSGERSIPLDRLHRLPGETPWIESDLEPGEVITAIFVPREAAGRAQAYAKLRHRASFEWPLVSAAVSLALVEGTIEDARIALGAVAHKPWRAETAERLLIGRRIDDALAREAGEAATDGARPIAENAAKIPLMARIVTRALQDCARQQAGDPS
ncbi:FAD binding domain-containing protein [Salinarimonas ramus]|uniref:Dehydrogenase n=1 Tax=Salinarimonas ramus TaxID=690164 RepID=A0A917V4U4_9HYPH|nr:xanthine dehydrogenase family protein subunit M [Salinarimonas ramus]GGK39966.1 dehydrogenase [Salinarimonas ramus]